jgi:hypothetical protein
LGNSDGIGWQAPLGIGLQSLMGQPTSGLC